MAIYTYIVEHNDPGPAITAGDTINGGKLQAVAFYDAMKNLEEIEQLLSELRDSTSCNQTKYAIDDFMN